MDKARVIQRLWAKDPSLFGPQNGPLMFDWLNAPQKQLESLSHLQAIKTKLERLDFESIVLMGMGGSSIGPRVFQSILAPSSAYNFHIIDTIHPSAIKDLEDKINIKKSLFIIASKSGSTLEPLVLYNFFLKRLEDLGVKDAARHFMAITDPVSPLEQESVEKGFLQGPFGHPGIGGRYSALSPFGLMPALLMNIDAERLLNSALNMAKLCAPQVKAEDNPGVELGVFMGLNVQRGRDQLVFHFSKSLEPFGWWLEQLIAESLGKKNSGIVPIVSPHKSLKSSAAMHCFIELAGEELPTLARSHDFRIVINDKYEIGQEMFRWQIAVSIAAVMLQVNPFDQPDVEKSKISARAILDEMTKNKEALAKKSKSLNQISSSQESFESAGLIIYDNQGDKEAVNIVAKFLAQSADATYGVILSYLYQNPANIASQKSLSDYLRRKLSVPTLLQIGPSYLHSTGQLFKGGKNQGCFIMLTGPYDIDFPSFNPGIGIKDIHLSQALGDERAMTEGGRKILRIHLKDSTVGFKELLALIKQS